MKMRMKYLMVVFMTLALAFAFTSCFGGDEPDVIDGGADETEEELRFMHDGTDFIGADDNTVIRMETRKGMMNSILTLTSEYPMIGVSSIFSGTAQAPTIAYLGEFPSLEEVPLTTDRSFSEAAEIHDNGGYLIKMTQYGSLYGVSGYVEVTMRMFIKSDFEDHPDDIDSGMATIFYDIYILRK